MIHGNNVSWLNVDSPPDLARDLVSTLEEIGRSLDILPHPLESSILGEVKARKLQLRKWRHSFLSATANDLDSLPGRIPTFEEVEYIRRKAAECQQQNDEEFSWNSQVHLRLLESVYEDGYRGQCGIFNAMSCITARPHRDFETTFSPTKMIHIGVYAALEQDADWTAQMDHFSRTTPTYTVNHTDFEAVNRRPTLLGIETKKPGVHWDNAQLQIGIWHAAQRSFLSCAVAQKLARHQSSDRGDVDTDASQPIAEGQEELQAKKRAALSTLGFVPGVIVQGYRWHLVLSTYEDGKTTLWTDHVVGSTQSCLEIYSMIAGMRHLTAWARDTYLPWCKANVLD